MFCAIFSRPLPTETVDFLDERLEETTQYLEV
jgi:hypothetical protein